jgi:hypothetical protein
MGPAQNGPEGEATRLTRRAANAAPLATHRHPGPLIRRAGRVAPPHRNTCDLAAVPLVHAWRQNRNYRAGGTNPGNDDALDDALAVLAEIGTVLGERLPRLGNALVSGALRSATVLEASPSTRAGILGHSVSPSPSSQRRYFRRGIPSSKVLHASPFSRCGSGWSTRAPSLRESWSSIHCSICTCV